jgi:hypothetical protein
MKWLGRRLNSKLHSSGDLRKSPPLGGGDRKEAIFQSVALIGGVVLARAVQNEQFSEEILKSVRQK